MEFRPNGVLETDTPPPPPKRNPPKLHRRAQPPETATEMFRQPSPEPEYGEEEDDGFLNSVPSRPSEWDYGNEPSDPLVSSETNSPVLVRSARKTVVLDQDADTDTRATQRRVETTSKENQVNGSSDLVRDIRTTTHTVAPGAVGDTANGVLQSVSNTTGAIGDRKSDQLKLKLDLNLDIEVQLKAKIRGDLTLQLMS